MERTEILQIMESYCYLSNGGRYILIDTAIRGASRNDLIEVYGVLTLAQKRWFISTYGVGPAANHSDIIIADSTTPHYTDRIVNSFSFFSTILQGSSSPVYDTTSLLSTEVHKAFGIYAAPGRSEYKLRLEQAARRFNSYSNPYKVVVERTLHGVVLHAFNAGGDALTVLREFVSSPVTLRMTDQLIPISDMS